MSDSNKIVSFQAIPAGTKGFMNGGTEGGIVALGEKGQLWWMSAGTKDWKALPDLPNIANKNNRIEDL